jgi:predicted amidohydrolase
MIIALASPRVATSLEEGLETVRKMQAEAAAQGAAIICFPEAYLPGLRGQDFTVLPYDQPEQELVVRSVAQSAHRYRVTTIMGMELVLSAGRQVAACVMNADGQIQGYQIKCQLDPSEDRYYVPGTGRQLFEVNGVPFGIAICHEGWRYPETVRWAAQRGAKIVFQPQHTGSNTHGVRLTEWGSAQAPYYEKAMLMRSIENTVYFASVNYALAYQESATTLIAPNGVYQAHLPYGQEGLLIQELDLTAATGLLAQRYAPERYAENSP